MIIERPSLVEVYVGNILEMLKGGSNDKEVLERVKRTITYLEKRLSVWENNRLRGED